jgi:hypothetical protein
MRPRDVPGVLVLYRFRRPYAETVLEHATALRAHSRYPVYQVNVARGFPPALRAFRFAAVILHYSLFGWLGGDGALAPELDDEFKHYLHESKRGGRRLAFFQDEYRHCGERFAVVDAFEVDTVYTLVEPKWHDATYGSRTRASTIVSTLAGYVSERLVAAGRRYGRPDGARELDIGYRARDLPYYLGAGSRDKTEIAIGFRRRVPDDLRVDVSIDAPERLYGNAWYSFLGNTRGVLGVEGGATVFDLDGDVMRAYDALLASEPDATWERFTDAAHEELERCDGALPYMMVTPRHFEAAALRTVQILFEGSYSGVLEPGRHYLPLRKDFSNLDEVLTEFRRPDRRLELARATYDDLIASGEYSYARFVEGVDGVLATTPGLLPAAPDRRVAAALALSQQPAAARRRAVAHARLARRALTSRLRRAEVAQ